MASITFPCPQKSKRRVETGAKTRRRPRFYFTADSSPKSPSRLQSIVLLILSDGWRKAAYIVILFKVFCLRLQSPTSPHLVYLLNPVMSSSQPWRFLKTDQVRLYHSLKHGTPPRHLRYYLIWQYETDPASNRDRGLISSPDYPCPTSQMLTLHCRKLIKDCSNVNKRNVHCTYSYGRNIYNCDPE